MDLSWGEVQCIMPFGRESVQVMGGSPVSQFPNSIAFGIRENRTALNTGWHLRVQQRRIIFFLELRVVWFSWLCTSEASHLVFLAGLKVWQLYTAVLSELEIARRDYLNYIRVFLHLTSIKLCFRIRYRNGPYLSQLPPTIPRSTQIRGGRIIPRQTSSLLMKKAIVSMSSGVNPPYVYSHSWQTLGRVHSHLLSSPLASYLNFSLSFVGTCARIVVVSEQCPFWVVKIDLDKFVECSNRFCGGLRQTWRTKNHE
jgi:hypothetical protein